MMVQQRSLTFHKGEPEDHKLAVYRLQAIFNHLGKQGLDMHEGVPLEYSTGFQKQLPSNRTYIGHNADLGIYSWIVDMDHGIDANIPKIKLDTIIEIHGDTEFWYISPLTGRKRKGTPTKHSKALQKRNDKVVSNWCEQNNVKYIVLKKEEILGDCTQDDYIQRSLGYIKENLKDYLK